MKQIITAIAATGILFSAVNVNADDLNILTSNRTDIAIAADSDSARPMVVFLLDTSQVTESGGSSSGGGSEPDCSSTDGAWNASFSSNFPHSVSVNKTVNINNLECNNLSWLNTASGETVYKKNAKEVVKYIMQRRSDVKYGVWALNTSSAVQKVAVGHYTGAGLTSQLAVVDLIDEGSTTMPLSNGLDVIHTYLSGASSPLSSGNECKNLQLIVIANGGWTANSGYASTALGGLVAGADETTFLKNAATYLNTDGNVKSGCGHVSVSVIGYKPGSTALSGDLFDGYNAAVANSSVAQQMATNGGGFSYVGNASGIAAKIMDYLDYMYPKATTVVTPTAPISANRAQHNDELYATGFKPKNATSWQGSISKWTTSSDAAGVRPIIAGELHDNFISAANTAAARKIYSTNGVSAGSAVTALVTSQNLEQDDIDWLKTDLSGNLGDPVHFRPLAIDYGGGIGTRLILGTNKGLLHMLTSGGVESWALLPKELERLIPALRRLNKAPSYSMMDHFYGVDGSPSVFIHDANRDGDIESGDGDKVLLYFGLRRGGSTIYALDITTPDAAPTFLWSKGEMEIDYGPFQLVEDNAATETGGSTSSSVDSLGGCAVMGVRLLQSGLGASLLEYSGTQYWSVGEHELLANMISSGLSGENLYTLIPTEVTNGNITRTSEKQMHCHDDLSGKRSFAFKSNPGASYGIRGPLGTANQCLHKDHNTHGIAVGHLEKPLQVIAGFGLNGLPENAVITSARLRFSHNDSNNSDAPSVYANGIAVSATFGTRDDSATCRDPHGNPGAAPCGAYFGTSYGKDSHSGQENAGGAHNPATWADAATGRTGSCADYHDPGRRTFIGKLQDPSPAGGNYDQHGLWAEATLYPQTMFPDLYTGAETNVKGWYTLTTLFREVVEDGAVMSNCSTTDAAAKFMNDKFTCLAWTQFKLHNVTTSANADVAVFEAPALGPLLDDNWPYAPELVLTWKLKSELTGAELSEYNSIDGAFSSATRDSILSGNGTCLNNQTDCGISFPSY